MKHIFLYKKINGKIIETDNYAIVDDDDYDKLSVYKWFAMKFYHCKTDILYARRSEGSYKKGTYRIILMHRQIVGAKDRNEKVDHRDANGLNNIKTNIRICTHSENMSNRKVAFSKKIKYLGVVYSKKYDKYFAAMSLNYKEYTSSYVETPELAALAYNELIKKYKPTSGRLNIVPCQ